MSQQAKQDTQKHYGRMHCCVSDWYRSFSLQWSKVKAKWTQLHRIYIATSPPVLCTDWAHVLWWSMIKTPHHSVYVIYSNPQLSHNRWSHCWPSLVPCTYYTLRFSNSEMRHLELFCCWMCYNSAFGSTGITVHPVWQTSNLCLSELVTSYFMINYRFTTAMTTIISSHIKTNVYPSPNIISGFYRGGNLKNVLRIAVYEITPLQLLQKNQ